MEKLKVLFLPAWYPSKFNKVGGVFVREHAKTLHQKVELAVFHVCEHPYLRKLYEFETVIEDGILTYRIYYRKFSTKWLKPISILFFALAVVIGYQKVYRKFKPTLNHVHVLTRMGVIALLAKIIYRTPFVITEHWSRYLPERNTYKGLFRKVLTKAVVKKSSGLSTVTQNLKVAMQLHGLIHHHFQVIPNVVNTDLFKPSNQVKEDFVFLHVSGLNDEVKNVSGILRAFSEFLNQKDALNTKLVIVGDDDLERPVLESYAEKLELTENVSFIGKKYNKDLVNEYQQANAFVLFSNFENQPCVILEAMSCGLPIISSSVGGISEIIDEKVGVLVEARNEQSLQEAMQGMYYKYGTYNGDLIRETAIESFAYYAVSSKLISFYNLALA